MPVWPALLKYIRLVRNLYNKPTRIKTRPIIIALFLRGKIHKDARHDRKLYQTVDAVDSETMSVIVVRWREAGNAGNQVGGITVYNWWTVCVGARFLAWAHWLSFMAVNVHSIYAMILYCV